MKLLAWKGDFVVDGTNSRMRKVIETDYETIHRQKRIAEMQRIDIATGVVWIVVCLFGLLAVCTLGERVIGFFHQASGFIR